MWELCRSRRVDVEAKAEQEREALWAKSVRRYNARQQQNLRYLWCEHYRKMRGVHHGLGDEYDQKLRALENGHTEEGG